MLSNIVTHARRYIALLALAATAFLPGMVGAEPPAVCQPKVFHVATINLNDQVTRIDLADGSEVTIMSADRKRSYRVSGHALNEDRVRLTITETTESEPVSAVETLTLGPGFGAARSALASITFALDDGSSDVSATSEEGGVCDRGLPRDPTAEGCGCVSCGGRTWCCCASSGRCCGVYHCGIGKFCF